MMSLQIPQQQQRQEATAAVRSAPPSADDDGMAIFPSQLLMDLNQQGLSALSNHDFDEAIQLIRQALTLLQSYCRSPTVDGTTTVANLTLAPAELALYPLLQNTFKGDQGITNSDQSVDHNILAVAPTVFCLQASASSSIRLDVLSAAVLYNLAYACQTKALVLRALSATPTYAPCTQLLLLSHQEMQREWMRAEKLYRMSAAAAQRALHHDHPEAHQPTSTSTVLSLLPLLLPLCNNRAHVALQLLDTVSTQQCLTDLRAFLAQVDGSAQQHPTNDSLLIGMNDMILNVLQWNGLQSAPAA